MSPIFSNRKTRLDSPEKLFFFLDKIINISLIKIERGEAKSIRGILSDLEVFLNKFWTLKQKNPGRFLSLVSSQDIYENACPVKMPGHFYEENSFDAQCADNLKMQTLLHSQYSNGRELQGFARLLSGFYKIWERAYHFNQIEVTSAVFQILDRFLRTLLEKPFNDLFVEAVIKIYITIFERLLKFPENSQMEHDMRHSILWYQQYQLNRESLKNPFDDFVYEDLLDQAIYKMMMLLVSSKQEGVLDIFLGVLSEKTDRLSQSEHSLLDIFHILEKGNKTQYEIFNQHNFYLETIEKLNTEMLDLDSLPKIRAWIQRENNLLEQIRPHLDISQKPHFNEVESDIQRFLQYLFRKQKILEIMDVTIAYSLVRGKLVILKSIFLFRLPYDTNHSWFVDFILPKTLVELLLFLNRKQRSVSKYSTSDGYRVPESFYEKSSLLLISFFLQRKDINRSSTEYATIIHNGSTLTSIRCSLDTLIQEAHGISREQNYLADLGIPDELKVVHWKEHVIPFLENLKSMIDQKVLDLKTTQKISPAKVDDFRSGIFGKFKKNALMRKLFEDFGSLVIHLEEQPNDVTDRTGLNVIDDKSQFLDHFEDACSLQLLDYGVKLASAEDLFMFSRIRKFCSSVSWKDIEGLEARDYVIVCTDLSFQSVILKRDGFLPAWPGENQGSVRSFQAGYRINNTSYPLMVVDGIKDEEGILLIPLNNLGKWHQWSPLNPGEATNLLLEYLYISVTAFSEDSPMMNEFLENPPAWLRDLGSREKQELYLMEHVLVHIFERFQWYPPSHFKGYSLTDSL